MGVSAFHRRWSIIGVLGLLLDEIVDHSFHCRQHSDVFQSFHFEEIVSSIYPLDTSA